MSNAFPQNTTAPDTDRWDAVVNRQPVNGSPFIYAVRNTGVYCRPGCASRTPKRENVRFFSNCRTAELAGYRACLRCKPNDVSTSASARGEVSESTHLIINACRFIESRESPPTLEEIAEFVGRSPCDFQKVFTLQLGVSPKDYAEMTRVNRFSRLLQSSTSVLNAIFSAGYNASSRCYTEAPRMSGMTPDRHRKGGVGEVIELSALTESKAATDGG